MIKPNSTFKIPSYVKRRMATIVDPVERHRYKNAMIQATLEGNQVIAPKEKKGKGKLIEAETD